MSKNTALMLRYYGCLDVFDLDRYPHADLLRAHCFLCKKQDKVCFYTYRHLQEGFGSVSVLNLKPVPPHIILQTFSEFYSDLPS